MRQCVNLISEVVTLRCKRAGGAVSIGLTYGQIAGVLLAYIVMAGLLLAFFLSAPRGPREPGDDDP